MITHEFDDFNVGDEVKVTTQDGYEWINDITSTYKVIGRDSGDYTIRLQAPDGGFSYWAYPNDLIFADNQTEFKVGDEVQYLSQAYKVLGINGDWLWVIQLNAGVSGELVNVNRVAKVVESDEWEEGATYTHSTDGEKLIVKGVDEDGDAWVVYPGSTDYKTIRSKASRYDYKKVS